MSAYRVSPPHPAQPGPQCRRLSLAVRLRAERPPAVHSSPLLHLLDDRLQMLGHRRNGFARKLHLAAGVFLHDEIERPVRRILLRIIITEMSAAALFPCERATRDGLRHREQVVEIERGVPTRIVLAVAADADLRRARLE